MSAKISMPELPQVRWDIPLNSLLLAAMLLLLPVKAVGAVPNGTWLSRPQIWFHTSTNTLPQVMARIKGQRYRYVFLDYRNVTDGVQQYVSAEARKQRLIPIVWVQSPQYPSLSVRQLVHEARHGDGIQVDDHFFANYSYRHFQALDASYRKPIFCSIQPFQVAKVPRRGCTQLDVQCYTPQTFFSCMKLADRLRAVTSLSTKNTLRYRGSLGGRAFNTFLWPHTNEYRRY